MIDIPPPDSSGQSGPPHPSQTVAAGSGLMRTGWLQPDASDDPKMAARLEPTADRLSASRRKGHARAFSRFHRSLPSCAIADPPRSARVLRGSDGRRRAILHEPDEPPPTSSVLGIPQLKRHDSLRSHSLNRKIIYIYIIFKSYNDINSDQTYTYILILIYIYIMIRDVAFQYKSAWFVMCAYARGI